jgi:hypothetical protein
MSAPPAPPLPAVPLAPAPSATAPGVPGVPPLAEGRRFDHLRALFVQTPAADPGDPSSCEHGDGGAGRQHF